MRKKRVVQAGKCYHLVSRVAHRALFFDDDEKNRFVIQKGLFFIFYVDGLVNKCKKEAKYE
mgnify:CR=1 FL=1